MRQKSCKTARFYHLQMIKHKLGLQLSPVYIMGKFTLKNCKTLYIFVHIYSLIRLTQYGDWDQFG